MKKNGFFIWLILCCALGAGSLRINAQPSVAPLVKSATTAEINLKIFDALWSKVSDKYYDSRFGGLDWLKVRETYRPRCAAAVSRESLLGLLRQMLGELRASHLNVWIAVSEKLLEKRIGANFDAQHQWLMNDTGFNTKKIAGRQTIVDVIKGSPAAAAGLQPGWLLVAVGGQSPSDDWWQRVDWSRDREMIYRFIDNDGGERELPLTRDYLPVDYVRESRLLEDGIGYLKFDTFQTRGTGAWFQQSVAALSRTKSLIVDLRGNGGGLVKEVKSCLTPLFAADTEFRDFVERGGKTREQRIKGAGARAYPGKVIVLVDEYTGSGAEIFAALIQETGRGLIVGQRTRGIVLNSLQYGLPENFELQLPFRDYLTPNEMHLEGRGVKPDIEVPLTIEDLRAGRDRGLEEAIKSGRSGRRQQN